MKLTRFKYSIGITIMVLLFIIPNVSAQQGGSQSQGNQEPQDGTKSFTLDNSNQFELSVTSNVSYEIGFDESVSNRMFGLSINSNISNSLSFNFSAGSEFHTLPPQFMFRYQRVNPSAAGLKNDKFYKQPIASSQQGRDDETEVDFTYNTFYTLNISGDYDNITFYTEIESNFGFPKGLSGDYSWIIFTEEEWYLLDSTLNETTLSAEILGDEFEGQSFTLSIVDFSVEPPIEGMETWVIVIISIGTLFVVIFGLMMTKQEYRSYLMNRFIDLETGPHRLTMKQVLENQNREKIINTIIDTPGIHFNEILREVQISAGNLAWHLDILVSYKVIRKQRIGQYLIYYPYLDKNPISKIDMSLRKSKTTLEILQLIDDNPGIYQNQIAKRMDLDHKTVKYHLIKLLEAEAVSAKQQGRKKLYFPIPPLED